MASAILVFLTTLFNPVLLVGPEGARVNPAQLAYPERVDFGCRLLGLRAGLENNSFNFVQYNRYTGAFLDQSAKDDILGSIPADGLGLNLDAQSSAAEFGWGTLAATVRTEASAAAKLPRDAFELLLLGNELGRVYAAEGTAGRASVYWRAGLSAGTALGGTWFVGAGLHYLRGLYAVELTEATAALVTTPAAFWSSGRVAYHTASGGRGWATDAGVAWCRGQWRVSVGCVNLGPGIEWTQGVQEGLLVYSLDSSNLQQIVAGDRFQSRSSREAGARFTTPLPAAVNAGVACRLSDRLNVGLLLVQRFIPSDGLLDFGSTLSIETWPLRWLVGGLSVGYAAGSGLIAGIDAGLILGRVALTTGARNRGGVFLGARGVEYQFGIGVGDFHNERAAPGPTTLRLRYGGD